MVTEETLNNGGEDENFKMANIHMVVEDLKENIKEMRKN